MLDADYVITYCHSGNGRDVIEIGYSNVQITRITIEVKKP